MSIRRSISQALMIFSCALWIVPPAAYADRVGAPYRGPRELLAGSSDAERDLVETPEESTDENDPGQDTGEDSGPDLGQDSGQDPDQAGQETGSATSRVGGNVAVLDGTIVWQWWWEYNKDRFLARATKRGKVRAGSINYWFGSGAKFPPRQIVKISPRLKNGNVFKTINQGLMSSVPAVRAEAAIAMGRLADVPLKKKYWSETKSNNLVVRQLIRYYEQETDAEVRQSMLLGLGLSGDKDATAYLLKTYDGATPKEKAYIAIALGLARHTPAIETLVKSLPTSASASSSGPMELGAIHGLGLMGPDAVTPEALEEGGWVKKLEDLASRRSGRVDILTQCIAALGRLQQGVGTVTRQVTNRTKNVQWTAILTLANYSGDEKMAAKAAAALVGREGIRSSQGQAKTFAILAAGDLAGRLDPNSSVRERTLLKALREALARNDIYTRSAAAVALGLADDRRSITAIAEVLETSSDNFVVAGACLSLGLLRSTDHAQLVLEKVLIQTKFKPDTRGYAALGLALMGDTTRVGQIKKYQRGKGLAMETLRQTPLALSILGGKTEVSTLVGHFNRGFKKNELYRASNAAYGLTWNRDVSAVNWLLNAYAKSGDKNVRGLSLVALGYLAARDEVSPLTRCYSNFSFRKRFDWDVLATISGIL